MATKTRWLFGLALTAIACGLFFYVSRSFFETDKSENVVRVLAYSSFTSSWGPGPEIVKMFEAAKPGVKVVLLQAEDAGLLLAKMRSFPADVVLGFDQLGRGLAIKSEKWRAHGINGSRFSDAKFLAFDWAPLGFIYREGEIKPPKDFDDLLDLRFEGRIALQDPRSSSPGFQFLNWLVVSMGEEKAFEYLRQLKPNVHSMSGSWSQAYGIFTRGLAKVTFGYQTSILYHRLSEKDERYRFVKFPATESSRQPVQVEFAAIPEACGRCDLAAEFMRFLIEPDVQSVIMNKNWMLPVTASAAKGTPFEPLMISEAPSKIGNQDNVEAMLKRWREAVL